LHCSLGWPDPIERSSGYVSLIFREALGFGGPDLGLVFSGLEALGFGGPDLGLVFSGPEALGFGGPDLGLVFSGP